MKRLSIAVFIFFSCLGKIHSQEYLGNDIKFFQKKAKLIQLWLHDKNLDKIFSVDKIELAKNGLELELFLVMNSSNLDTAASTWLQLTERFREQNQQISIESALYDTFTRFMEIPPSQGNIQIYVPKKEGGYSPCFYVWIWNKDGRTKVESRINNCRSKPIQIAVNFPQIKQVSTQSEIEIEQDKNGKVVFEKILEFAQEKYEHQPCKNRYPRVGEKVIDDYSLTFTVTDLCREVLTDEKISLWCNFVELWWGNCNDMRRERLEFTFYYFLSPQGYRLSGMVTGKFGSGVYKPRISGYMDMEPDFEEDFLVPYVIKFQNELQEYLEKQ